MRELREIDFSPLGSGPWPAPVSPAASERPSHCEYLVIGGGVTGWSCALALAANSRDVVLVDRAFGRGAACRSGGIIVGDTLVGPAAAFEGCEFDLRAWIEKHAADLPLDWSGVLELDRSASLPVDPIDWRDGGVVRASAEVPGGAVDPAALLARLAAEAVHHGTRFVDRFAVRTVHAHDGHVVVDGPAGRIEAGMVIAATDATSTAAGFEPWPVRQFTVALETAPLGGDQLAAAGWSGQPFYTNGQPLLWGRRLADGALLAGRETIPLTNNPIELERAVSAAGDRILSRVRGLHPAFRRIERVRAWAGPIGRDERGIPAVHWDPDVPGLLWAGGYGGHGLAQAFRLGSIAAHGVTMRWDAERIDHVDRRAGRH